MTSEQIRYILMLPATMMALLVVAMTALFGGTPWFQRWASAPDRPWMALLLLPVVMAYIGLPSVLGGTP